MIAYPIPFPTLLTSRLCLRQLHLDDRYELEKLRSDEVVNKYLNRPKSITIDEAEAYVHKIDGLLKDEKCVYWAITLKNDPTFIGTICLWNFQPEQDIAELGYELSPAHHGRGLMLEAVEKVIAFGFEVMQLKVITALINTENVKSINILTKNNFSEDPDFTYVKKEDARDLVVYFLRSITKF